MRKQKCIIKSILSIKFERELVTDGEYIEYKKANGVKYADAIEEVNDIVKHVKISIDKVLNEVCCICGEELKDFGNDPYPISDEGRCCDKCNDKVIVARIKALKGE